MAGNSRSSEERRLLGSWFTIFVVLLVVPWAESSPRLDHGSPCSSQNECESRNVLLQCVQGICTCPQATESTVVLDSETQLCSGIIGSSCYRAKSALDSEEEVNPVRHYVPCFRNATCSRPARVCTCDRHHYPTQDKKSCPLQKDYDEACTEEGECDVFRYFVCSAATGRCACQADMEYNPKLDTCFKPIGRNCTRENLYDNPVFPGRYDSCPVNAECYNVCVCRPLFTLSSDGSCQRDYGSRCGPTQPCSDLQLACQNQKCVCKYPLHQVFDVASGQCLSRVPGPCRASSEEAVGIQCVENAVCVEGQCRCLERYGQDRDGFCLKPYGYDCELDRECSNVSTPLACVNNQCSCPDLLQDYDRETGKCVGQVGSRCSLDSNSLESRSRCDQNSYCKAFGPTQEFGHIGECVLLSLSSSATPMTDPTATPTQAQTTATDYHVFSEEFDM